MLARLYEGDRYVPRAVLVPAMPAEPAMLRAWLEHKRGARVELAVPQRGDRKKHLTLAMQDAELADRVAVDAEARRREAAERLARGLGLEREGGEAPERLHCLDVATIQGTSTVASRVCFVDGAPHKAHYRRFRISPANAGDDFAAMQEAVRRSLTLCLERDDEELPDLLVVDGGRGQLGAAEKALAELGLTGEVLVCGLAKSRLKGVGGDRCASAEGEVRPGGADPGPRGRGASARTSGSAGLGARAQRARRRARRRADPAARAAAALRLAVGPAEGEPRRAARDAGPARGGRRGRARAPAGRRDRRAGRRRGRW